MPASFLSSLVFTRFHLALLSGRRIFGRQRGVWELLNAVSPSEGCWAPHSPFGRLQVPLVSCPSLGGPQPGMTRAVHVQHQYPWAPTLSILLHMNKEKTRRKEGKLTKLPGLPTFPSLLLPPPPPPALSAAVALPPTPSLLSCSSPSFLPKVDNAVLAASPFQRNLHPSLTTQGQASFLV